MEFKVTSYTKRAADLKENYLHAILSSFPVSDTPSIDTFLISTAAFGCLIVITFPIPSTHQMKSPKSQVKRRKASSLEKVTVENLLKQFELHPPADMVPSKQLYNIFKVLLLDHSVQTGLITPLNLSLPGDGTPVYTAAQEPKKRTCQCPEIGIRDRKCEQLYKQPDCNIGCDSHREHYYFGYDLYMLTASDSENDLPVSPFLRLASRHDSIRFLYSGFSMKLFLPEAKATKLLPDSAHGAMPYYEYCHDHRIVSFIDLNADRGPRIQR